MPLKNKRNSLRDISVQRDVIMGNQINSVDTARLESLLEQIVDLLRQPKATVQIGHDVKSDDSVIIVAGDGNSVNITPLDVRAFSALQRSADPRHRILGEPGAGKTTTLDRFALELARGRLRDPLRGKLPVRINLFNFVGEKQLPADFLKAQWDTTGLSESYGEAIAAGAVCFLLDGVNQMPLADRSKRVELWKNWANSEADLPLGNWAIFTCRTADYVTNLRLPEVRVQTLDTERIRKYFEMRFGVERTQSVWVEFEKRLRSGDDRFERLARNPFMLSIMADRVAAGKTFADSRAALMDDLASRRLEHELDSGRQPDALTADKRGTLNAALDALGRIAFTMQARGEGNSFTRTSIAKTALVDAKGGALKLSGDEVIELAVDASLIEASGETPHEIFSFRYHLLQEYFAACELLRQFCAHKNMGKHWAVAWRALDPRLAALPLQKGERLPTAPVTGWEETVIMTAGLAGKDTARFIEAVRQGNLPLAGRCLVEAGVERDDLKTITESARTDLLTRQRKLSGIDRAHLRARIDAGLALGELGHPDLSPQKFEFEGKAVWAIPPKMQNVAAGEFIRGSEASDKDSFKREHTTERRLMLPAFSMGRYPVTNAEYRFFIEAGGYKTDRWWSVEGLKWK